MTYFADYYELFYETTRMQRFRGSTPEELRPLHQPIGKASGSVISPAVHRAFENGTITADSLRETILTMTVSSEDYRFNLLKEVAQMEADKKKRAVSTCKQRQIIRDNSMGIYAGYCW